MNDHVDVKGLRCSNCDCAIECCEFCEEENCRHAICFSCMIVSIDQEIRQPHPHGG